MAAKHIKVMSTKQYFYMQKNNPDTVDPIENMVVDLNGYEYLGLNQNAIEAEKNISEMLDTIGSCPVTQDTRSISGWIQDCRSRGIANAHLVANAMTSFARRFHTQYRHLTAEREYSAIEYMIRKGEQVILVADEPKTNPQVADIVQIVEGRLRDVLPMKVQAGKQLPLSMDPTIMVQIKKLPQVAQYPAVAMEFDGRDLEETTQSEIASWNRAGLSQSQRLREEYTLNMEELTYERTEDGWFTSLRNPMFESIRTIDY